MLAKAKERGANPFENAPQPNDTRKSSTVDPLLGWFSLADGVKQYNYLRTVARNKLPVDAWIIVYSATLYISQRC